MRSRGVCLFAIQQPTTVRIVGTKVLAEEAATSWPARIKPSTDVRTLKSFRPRVNPRGGFLQKRDEFSYLKCLLVGKNLIILEEMDLTACLQLDVHVNNYNKLSFPKHPFHS
jgi:hypothetical protein